MQRLAPIVTRILALTGCAAIRANETHWTEQLLTEAGFRSSRPPRLRSALAS